MAHDQEYYKNKDVERLYKRIRFLKLTFLQLEKTLNQDKVIDQFRFCSLIEELRIYIANNSINKAFLNIVLKTQLQNCIPPKGTSWDWCYKELSRSVDTMLDLAERTIEANEEPIFHELIEVYFKSKSLISKFLNSMDVGFLSGSIDNCVIPTKNRLSDIPKDGTLLGFDIVGSKMLKKKLCDSILDEVKRIAFAKQGWEWSDIGSGLLLLFFDHNPNSVISHKENTLYAAIEIMARVTYKFPNCTSDFRKKALENNPSIQPKYQKLRLVINSFKKGESMQSAEEVNAILHDKDLKFNNTIFIIGDGFFEGMTDKALLFEHNFSQTTRKHDEINKPIFWSSPIGWETLNLHRQAALFVKKKKRIQRDPRYQVPNQTEIDLFVDKNQVDEAILFDISRTGLRLRLKNGHISQYNHDNIHKKMTFLFKCKEAQLKEIEGKIVDLYQTEGKNNCHYARIEFLESLDENLLLDFLYHCDYSCNSIECI